MTANVSPFPPYPSANIEFGNLGCSPMYGIPSGVVSNTPAHAASITNGSFAQGFRDHAAIDRLCPIPLTAPKHSCPLCRGAFQQLLRQPIRIHLRRIV